MQTILSINTIIQMKKIYLLLSLFIAGMPLFAQTDAQLYPQWLQELVTANSGLIDSAAAYNAHPSAPDYRTYVIYYHQPLLHANPGGAQFHMRALITVNKNADPRTAVNHVYASGYSISSDMLANPDSVFNASKTGCSSEIAHRYNANYISIEHRYFQYSAPDNCWENLDPLTAEEAATDFHNLFDGLKKVLKGKWVMSGVSKGGITTLIQHAYYPNDMDIFVPYSAPFFDTDRDKEMARYWYHTGWDKSFLDFFMDIRKKALKGLTVQPRSTNTIYPIYYKMSFGGDTTAAHADSILANYLSTAAFFGFDQHAYWDTTIIRYQMEINDSVLQAIGWDQYNDTAIAYLMFKDSFNFNSLRPWLDTLRKYPDPKQQVPGRRMMMYRGRNPFGVTAEQWWGADTARTDDAGAYQYQSKRELGYFDIPFDEITETAAEANALEQFWFSKAGCLRDFGTPWVATLKFSRSLYDFVMDKTRNATKPIVLLYGLDDTWTGAAVKDQYVNGTNVKKFILPAQNHLVHYSSDTDITQCDAIRAALDAVLGAPQDIDNITPAQPVMESVKIMRNGQILILRGGKTYTLMGQEVR